MKEAQGVITVREGIQVEATLVRPARPAWLPPAPAVQRAWPPRPPADSSPGLQLRRERWRLHRRGLADWAVLYTMYSQHRSHITFIQIPLNLVVIHWTWPCEGDI